MKIKNLFEIFLPLLFVPLILYSNVCSEYAITAMRNCVTTVIPGLFPFMVLSSIVAESSITERLSRLFPFARLFGLPSEVSSAVIIGSVCGFSVGAKYTDALYKNGTVDRTTAEVLASVSCNISMGFLISIIGSKIFGKTYIGIILYFIVLLSNVISGILVNKVLYKTNPSSVTMGTTYNKSFSEKFCNAVTGSAISCVYITAYVTVFSVILGITSQFQLPNSISAVITSLLEFTNGAIQNASMDSVLGYFLCGFSCAFGGASVLFQIRTLLSKEISIKRLLLQKAISGIIAGLGFAVYLPFEAQVIEYSKTMSYTQSGVYLLITTAIFLILSLKNYKKVKIT